MINKIEEYKKINFPGHEFTPAGPNAVAINQIIDKVNEVIVKVNSFNVINKPSETTNEQPKLTDKEIKWLEDCIDAYNNQWGFEPNDIIIRDSIFKKLRLIV